MVETDAGMVTGSETRAGSWSAAPRYWTTSLGDRVRVEALTASGQSLFAQFPRTPKSSMIDPSCANARLNAVLERHVLAGPPQLRARRAVIQGDADRVGPLQRKTIRASERTLNRNNPRRRERVPGT